MIGLRRGAGFFFAGFFGADFFGVLGVFVMTRC
jgi:hypothetical protein